MSRQAARGHRAREHISRKEAAGLTPAQSAAINKWARAQAAKDDNNPNPDRMAAAAKQWAGEHGYHRFVELRDLNKQRHAEKDQRVRIRVGDRRISVAMYDLSADFGYFDLPSVEDGDDFAWLFYH